MFDKRLIPQVLKSLGLKKIPPRGGGGGGSVKLPPFINREHFEKYLKEMFKHFCTDKKKKYPYSITCCFVLKSQRVNIIKSSKKPTFVG